MKTEIKDGLFTSTQVSALLGMNVQTLREWQRKNYLDLPDTGGWQRYSIPNILTLRAFGYLIETGLTHEMASSIARFSAPLLSTLSDETLKAVPYLLVSLNPNEDPSFDLLEDVASVSAIILDQTSKSNWFVTRILVDFKDVYDSTFEALHDHVVHDGDVMFWKAESDQN